MPLGNRIAVSLDPGTTSDVRNPGRLALMKEVRDRGIGLLSQKRRGAADIASHSDAGRTPIASLKTKGEEGRQAPPMPCSTNVQVARR